MPRDYLKASRCRHPGTDMGHWKRHRYKPIHVSIPSKCQIIALITTQEKVSSMATYYFFEQFCLKKQTKKPVKAFTLVLTLEPLSPWWSTPGEQPRSSFIASARIPPLPRSPRNTPQPGVGAQIARATDHVEGRAVYSLSIFSTSSHRTWGHTRSFTSFSSGNLEVPLPENNKDTFLIVLLLRWNNIHESTLHIENK